MEKIIETMETVKLKINEYKTMLAKIGEKRQLWLDTTKNKIFEVLTEVKNLENMDWAVQKVEGIKNLEAVNLIFNKSSSGIVEKTSNGFKIYTKYGGGIAFSQAYNGNIFVILMYPSVEDHVGLLENKILDKINPDQITESYILSKIIEFLEEMSKWVNSNTKNNIGYKIEN